LTALAPEGAPSIETIEDGIPLPYPSHQAARQQKSTKVMMMFPKSKAFQLEGEESNPSLVMKAVIPVGVEGELQRKEDR